MSNFSKSFEAVIDYIHFLLYFVNMVNYIFKKNIEMQFTYHIVHHLTVYNSVVFSVLQDGMNITTI